MSTPNKSPTQPRRAPGARGPALADRPWLRRLIGVCLLWHITAVAVAPFSVLVGLREEPPGGGPPNPTVGEFKSALPAGTPPPPPAEDRLPAIDRLEESVFRWYLNSLYLNHGYSFFAPDPGPSQIMHYEVHREDGTVVRGRLPDLDHHWPRLLYHRYFMLASQNPQLMLDASIRGKVREGSTQTLGHAIARHLTQRYQGERTVLRLFLHRLLWPEEVLAGKSPNAPDTYLPDGRLVYARSSKGTAPEGPPSEVRPAEEVQP